MGSVMLFSLFLILFSYGLVCWHEKSFVHYLTPTASLLVVGSYMLPWAYMEIFGPFGSLYAYFYYYAAQSVTVFTSAIVYCYLRAPRIGWKPDRVPVRTMHWALLLLSVLAFAPILIKYSSLISNPREIYQETRSGGGIYYFTSSFILDLAFAFFLFAKNRRAAPSVLFIAAVALLSLLHGSKGQLLSFFWFWIIYTIYVEQKRFPLRKALATLLFPIVLIPIFFILFQGASLGNLFISLVQYSDYPRNAMLVIDDKSLDYKYGLFTIETTLYSRIPRGIFPSKPKQFGPFELAARYFSQGVWEDIGSPDFSIGLQYYDFGPFAILYLMAWSAISTFLLKGIIEKLKEGPSRANYVLVAFFVTGGFIPIGVSYTLPEHFILAYLLAIQGRMRIRLL